MDVMDHWEKKTRNAALIRSRECLRCICIIRILYFVFAFAFHSNEISFLFLAACFVLSSFYFLDVY